MHEWQNSEIEQSDNWTGGRMPVYTGLITWIYEADSFVPTAKIQGKKRYSIISDYLGTPTQMYDEEGAKVWECELDIYGKIRTLAGRADMCPFRFKGQYHDIETELYYNRYRYYSAKDGSYISQDQLATYGSTNLYGYVGDTNAWTDALGLVGLNEGGYSVYGLYSPPDAKEPYYIGITNDRDRRAVEHEKTGRLGKDGEMRVLKDDLKYKEARGLEQASIEHYKTKTGKIGENISSINRGNKVASFDKTRTDARGKAFKKEYEKSKKELKQQANKSKARH